MVQNVSNSNMNDFGSINRIGNTNDGRVIYQIVDQNNQEALNISVAQKDSDVFEKSYQNIMESAPKLKHYMETTPPEVIEKKQKMAKWLVIGLAAIGGLIPAIKIKGNRLIDFLKQILGTTLGAGAGLMLGSQIASMTLTPPGAATLSNATKTLSKLDIKPVE